MKTDFYILCLAASCQNASAPHKLFWKARQSHGEMLAALAKIKYGGASPSGVAVWLGSAKNYPGYAIAWRSSTLKLGRAASAKSSTGWHCSCGLSNAGLPRPVAPPDCLALLVRSEFWVAPEFHALRLRVGASSCRALHYAAIFGFAAMPRMDLGKV